MIYLATDKDSENALIHYGVKGMKWGVRKARRSPAGIRASAKIAKIKAKLQSVNTPERKAARAEIRMIQKARKGTLNYKKLTDDQVKRVTQRLELEKKSRDLSGKNSKTHRFRQALAEGMAKGLASGTASVLEKKMVKRYENSQKRKEAVKNFAKRRLTEEGKLERLKTQKGILSTQKEMAGMRKDIREKHLDDYGAPRGTLALYKAQRRNNREEWYTDLRDASRQAAISAGHKAARKLSKADQTTTTLANKARRNLSAARQSTTALIKQTQAYNKASTALSKAKKKNGRYLTEHKKKR